MASRLRYCADLRQRLLTAIRATASAASRCPAGGSRTAEAASPDASGCGSSWASGRPFIVDGAPRLAGLAPRSDWLRNMAAKASPLAARIAAEWREDARMEHASIAAFARFTLDLLAFGAPAELVELAQRAALDEVEHARLCFGLAARYSGVETGPAPLPAADLRLAGSLWDAATSAFEEGCIGETLAALFAESALARARDPEVVLALQQIAEQEGRHAELAWRFVGWSLARLGPDLRYELERRLALAQQTSAAARGEPDRESPGNRAVLHAAGRLSAADKRRLTDAGLRDIVARCVAQLTPPAAVAGPALTSADDSGTRST